MRKMLASKLTLTSPITPIFFFFTHGKIGLTRIKLENENKKKSMLLRVKYTFYVSLN